MFGEFIDNIEESSEYFFCYCRTLTGAVMDSNPLSTLLKTCIHTKNQITSTLKSYKDQNSLEEAVKSATANKPNLALWSYIFRIVQEIQTLIEILETKLYLILYDSRFHHQSINRKELMDIVSSLRFNAMRAENSAETCSSLFLPKTRSE